MIDGTVVPQQPATFLSQADLASPELEVMIGFSKDEWQFFCGHSPTLQSGSKVDFVKIMAQVCGHDAAVRLFSRYSSLYPDHPVPQLICDVMSFEFFKFSSFKILQNLSRQGVHTYAYQFSYDLPGLDGRMRAYHTGETPIIWRNYSPEDLARWPAFEGIDRAALAHTADAFGTVYGNFIRTGDPGPNWPAYDACDATVLWFGPEVEPRRDLLGAELRAFEEAGLSNVRTLEMRLANNTRTALNVPARAYAAPRS